MAKQIVAYVIYHDEESKKEAEEIANTRSWLIPIYIPTGKFMESEVFALLQQREHEWKHADFVAILKHSFRNKTPFYDFEHIVNECNDHADVFTFVNGHEPPFQNTPMIITAACYHQLFHVIWYHLLKHFHIPYPSMFNMEIPAFFSNFWIARTPFFQEYLSFFAKARHIMEEDETLRTLLYEDATYFKRYSEDKYREIAGVPYQTYHCFVAERLPCFFFFTMGARICMIGKNRQIDPHIPKIM